MLSEQLASATCGQTPTTSSATSSSSGAAGGDDVVDGDDDSGCGCAVAPPAAPSGLALLAMFAAWRARAARPSAKRRSG